jgi:3-methyl-2-oxobutanoate hydroxymethyltransferase
MAPLRDVASFPEMKRLHKPICGLHVFDAPQARAAVAAKADFLLVSTLVGPKRLGYESALPVTLDEILHHVKAVKRAAPQAFLVAGMPYLAGEIEPRDALRAAGRLVKEGGAHAVKVEGGIEAGAAIKELLRCQIPVLGHLGLTPHSENRWGGIARRGVSQAEAEKLLTESRVIEGSGVFALVVERIDRDLARAIAQSLQVPVLGAGGEPGLDGSVLVAQDIWEARRR